MGSRSRLSFATAVALLLGSGAWPGLSCPASSPPATAGEPGGKLDPATVEFFESKVRPVLANHCWQCHGPDKQKAGLRLDSREAVLKGGETGPGDRDRQARGEPADRGDPLRRLGPDAAQGQARGRPRSTALTDWVKQGAPWPEPRRDVKLRDARPRRHSRRPAITAKDREFWSFRPVARAAASRGPGPRTGRGRRSIASSSRSSKRTGLRPAPPADRRTLHPPRDLRPDRPAADARGDRRLPRTTTRPTPSPGSSTACSPRRTTASGGGGTGSTSPATARTRPTPSSPGSTPTGSAIATGWSGPSTHDMPYDRFVIEQIAGDLLDEPGPPGAAAGPGLLRPGAGLLRRRQEARPVRRPDRHPDPRLPRPDRRLRPLPRPQVRPDPDHRLLRPGRRLRQHRVQGGPRCAPRTRSRPTTTPRPRSASRRSRSTASSRTRRHG